MMTYGRRCPDTGSLPAAPLAPPCVRYARWLLGALVAAVAALVVIGCEEAATGNGDERAALNPPAWLHGTWEYCVTAPGLVLTWTFTAGNAVTVSSGVSTDFGAQAETMTVNESDGADWYQIDVPDAGVSYRFRRAGARVQYTGTLSGSSTTLPLCRQ